MIGSSVQPAVIVWTSAGADTVDRERRRSSGRRTGHQWRMVRWRRRGPRHGPRWRATRLRAVRIRLAWGEYRPHGSHPTTRSS